MSTASASAAVAALDKLRLRVAAGADPGRLEGLPGRARRAVAVSEAVGAPLLPALDAAADAEADAARARRAIEVATAQTRVVAFGLVGAPVLLVPLFGRLFDLDLVGFYLQPLGTVVGIAGVLLLAMGGLIAMLLVRRIGRPPRAGDPRRRAAAAVIVTALLMVAVHPAAAPAGLLLLRRRTTGPVAAAGADEVVDLVASALTGGVSIGAALRATATVVPDQAPACRQLAFALELGRPPPDLPPGLDRLGSYLATAAATGAAVAPTLRRLAADLRAAQLARALAAAERLPAQLTFPTALCLLPAVLLLIGAPIVHAGLTAAGTP